MPYLRHRCRKYVIYDTAARSRHTPRTSQTLPWLFWHGVVPSLTLSCTPKWPSIRRATYAYAVSACIRRIIRPVSSYEVNNPYLRHRFKFAAQPPDRPSATTAVLAWSRAITEAIVYPKQSSTRRDTCVVSACTS